MSAQLDRLAHLARLSEDALRSAALGADPDEADALIARAGQRASQVEQLRALDRPAGATAAALAPAPHAALLPDDAERALLAACHDLASDGAQTEAARDLAARIAATCRTSPGTD